MHTQLNLVLRLALACASVSLSAKAIAAEAPSTIEASSAEDLQAFTRARLKSRPTLTHPNPNMPREASVYVRLMISAEGIPTEVSIVEDRGFHNEDFRREAIRYVKGMRFDPATKNGVPVEFGPVVQPIHFSQGIYMDSEMGVMPEFRRELDKIARLMEARDYPGAQFHAEWMLREKVNLRYEFAVLQAQLTQILSASGKTGEALIAAVNATSWRTGDPPGYRAGQPPPANDPRNYVLPRELVIYLLELRLRLLTQLGNLPGALQTYGELAGLETRIKDDDPRKVLAGKLQEMLESGKPLLFKATLKNSFWAHPLYHPRFTVLGVDGSLSHVQLYCRGERAQFDFVAGKEWSLPEGWAECTAEFYGEPGTTLELVEMPAASGG